MSPSETSTNNSPLGAIHYGVGTDVGRRREENQDSYGVLKNDRIQFFMVADGMGGAKGGAVASSLAVKVVEQAMSSKEVITSDEVARTLSKANSDIFKQGSEDEALSGMGTTFVGLTFFGERMIITNVGDSRAYRIRNNQITQLTDDHTLVNDLLRNGAITKEQAENHPVAHMLTRSLGPCPDVDVDSFLCEDGPARNDRYLLCSDGLYNVVPGEEILQIVNSKSIDEAVQELISLANDRGGPDNITIILVHVDENFPRKVEDYPKITYPRHVPRPMPETDAYDIRATREQYRSRKIVREHDDADIQVSTTKGTFGKLGQTGDVEFTPQTLFPHLKWGGFIILGLVMGFILSEASSFINRYQYPEIRTILINPLATELVGMPVIAYKFDSPELESGLFGLDRIAALGESSSENGFGLNQGLSRGQVEGVKERKQSVESTIAKLSSHLASLDSFKREELSAERGKIELEVTSLMKEMDRLTNDVTISSKNLATWIERKQKLSSLDAVDMASEIAFSSSYIRERKELFEKATWAYLREVEIWRFNPNDKPLAQRVSELGKAREQRRKELAAAIEKAVDDGKFEAEAELSTLSNSLKVVERRLEEQRGEAEFIKLVLAGDDKAKAQYREELLRRLELAKTELSELERFLPSR